MVKTGSSDPVLVGEVLTYTLEVKNNSTDPAQDARARDVVVTDNLPSGVQFVSAKPADAANSCAQTNGIVKCNLGIIDVEATDTITIAVRPAANTAGTTLLNTANVVSNTRDPNTANNEDTETTNFTNRAPAVGSAGDSYSTNEDVTLNESAPGVLANDSDPDGAQPGGAYEYDPDTGEGSSRCVFSDGPATSQVSVEATDSDEDSDGASRKVTVETVDNVDPTIDSVTADSPIEEGSSSTIVVQVGDPGDPDPLSYSFDCNGDGDYGDSGDSGDKGPQPGNSATCDFADNGTYTVNVRVTDGDGGQDTDSVQITVNNVPPEVTPPAGQSAVEGTSKQFDLGSFTDPGADGPWQVTVNWGDGTQPTTFTADEPGSLGTRPPRLLRQRCLHGDRDRRRGWWRALRFGELHGQGQQCGSIG